MKLDVFDDSFVLRGFVGVHNIGNLISFWNYLKQSEKKFGEKAIILINNVLALTTSTRR